MSLHEFEDKIRSKTKFERIGYLVQCSIIGILSFAMVIFTLFYSSRFGAHPLLLTFIFAVLLFVSCFGYYKLKDKYKIVSYYDSHSEEFKRSVIINILERLPITKQSTEENVFDFTYQKDKWSVDYEFDLFYNKNQISFVAIGRGYNRGGLIDFGRAEKMKNLLLSEIKNELRD